MELTSAFTRAVADAEFYHHDQKRKTTAIPYVSHLLGVCSLVLDAGGTEIEAIAALLHDAPEDAGGRPVLDAIRVNYGPEVADIVEDCSDTLVGKGEPKPPWRERKTAYIEHLRTASASAMLVSSADKLHNLRSIEADHARIGDSVYDRFNTGGADKKADVLWYYRSLLAIYVDPDVAADPRRTRLTTPLAAVLGSLERT